MNPIEALYRHLQSSYKYATVELTCPPKEEGVWSLDLDMNDKHLAV